MLILVQLLETLQLHSQQLSLRQLLRKQMYPVTVDLMVLPQLLLREVLVDIPTHGRHRVERLLQLLDLQLEVIP